MLARHTKSHIDTDPFISYARSLHDYTLRLWAESIRTTEEEGRMRNAAKKVAMSEEEGRVHKESAAKLAGIAGKKL